MAISNKFMGFVDHYHLNCSFLTNFRVLVDPANRFFLWLALSSKTFPPSSLYWIVARWWFAEAEWDRTHLLSFVFGLSSHLINVAGILIAWPTRCQRVTWSFKSECGIVRGLSVNLSLVSWIKFKKVPFGPKNFVIFRKKRLVTDLECRGSTFTLDHHRTFLSSMRKVKFPARPNSFS